MNTCTMCGLPIGPGNESLDLWAFNTRYYDTEGDDTKSMIQPDNLPYDYLVIGESCCGTRARELWTDLVQHIKDQYDINQGVDVEASK